MQNENIFLLYAVLMGIFITFVYDLLRIIRRVIPHAGFWVSVEDLGFWIYCAAEVFLLMYRESNGTLRWFAVLGALAGMAAYLKLVSGFLVKYASLILGKVLGALGTAVGWLWKPVRRLCTSAQRTMRAAAVRRAQRKRSGGSPVKKKLTFFLKIFKMKI